MQRIPGLMAEMNKSNSLAAITMLAINICIVTVFLLMTTSSELYAADGNTFIGNSDFPPFEKDPGTIPVDPPALAPDPSPVPDPLPPGWGPEPNPPAESLKQGPFPVRTVTGVLHRVAAIGGETTGWVIQLDSPTELLDFLEVGQIGVVSGGRLEQLMNSHVLAHGAITWRQGIERDRYPVMVIDWIRKY